MAQTKRSLKKTVRRVIDSFKKGGPRINPDAVKTGPRRRAPKRLTEAQKNLRLLQKLQDQLKNRKKPKVSDLLYRPKRDKDGKIIKPKPRDLLYRPKYDSKGNIIKPKAIPMKVKKPKKKWATENY